MTVSPQLDERFRAAAAAEGLLDVGYDVVDSPLGDLFVAATPRGLCRIAYDAEPEQQLEDLARQYGLRVLRAPQLDEPKRELMTTSPAVAGCSSSGSTCGSPTASGARCSTRSPPSRTAG